MIKLLTYLGPILIAAGLTKNYFYYNAFNIRILDYIELSETLTILTEMSVFIIIVIPFTWFAHFMLDTKKEHITEPERNKDLVEIAHEKGKFFKRLWIYLLRYWGASIMIILLFILSLFLKAFSLSDLWELDALLMTFLSSITFIVVLLEFRYKYKRIFEKELDNGIGTVLHYGGFFLIMMTFYTYVEIRGTKSGRIKNKEYTIELNNGEQLRTTKDLIAIGQTKNYFFLFDRTSQETTIIKRESINTIRVK